MGYNYTTLLKRVNYFPCNIRKVVVQGTDRFQRDGKGDVYATVNEAEAREKVCLIGHMRDKTANYHGGPLVHERGRSDAVDHPHRDHQ